MSANLELARLIGAYHARRGWGDAAEEARWRRSLSASERAWLRDYLLYGLAVFEQDAPVVIPPMVTIDVAIKAATMLSRHFWKIGEAIAGNIGSIGLSVAPAFADLSAALERIQRDRLYCRLSVANVLGLHMPARLARWIADRYPLTLLPDALRKQWGDLIESIRETP